jgi:hypothetical protein
VTTAERIAREHWNAALFLDGRRIFPQIALWDNLSANARIELLADIEAVLSAIEAAGMAVVEGEDGR